MKHIAIYILFALSAALILLNRFTDLYLSDYRLHYLMLFIASATFVIIVGHIFNKLKTVKSILTVFVVMGVLCFLKGFFTWGGDWKTETVVYRNLKNDNKTIDIQLRGDRFAFGYKKRIVEIYKLAPGILWTSDVDTLTLDPLEWKRMDQGVHIPNTWENQ